MMKKIYEQAKDLHVKSYMVYVSGNNLYEDASVSIPVDAETIGDAFNKDLLLVKDNTTGHIYKPIGATINGTGISVFALDNEGSMKTWTIASGK